MSLNNTYQYGNHDILSSDENGPGILTVADSIYIFGTTNSSSYTSGSLVVSGSLGLAGIANLNSDLSVNGITNLKRTNIDTDNGIFQITGSNKISASTSSLELSGAGNSNITVGSGNLTLNTLSGNLLSSATNIYHTASSVYDIQTGTFSLNATTGAALNLNTSANNQNLSLSLTGNTDSKISLSSTGTGTEAISLQTSAGGISVSAQERLSLQSQDLTNGVSVATSTLGVPVFIGSSTSNIILGNGGISLLNNIATVSGVSFNNGALSNVVSINGSVPDSVINVSLANDKVGVIISSTNITGNFLIVVSPNYAGGPHAQFIGCKSVSTSTTAPNLTIRSTGTSGEQLTTTWPSNSKILLAFSKEPGGAGTSFSFKVKIITV